MALIDSLVDHVLGVKYEDLPEQVTEVTRKSVLDTLAATIAGSSAEGVGQLAELVRGWGGRKESKVYVYGDRVPAPASALANCTMARALDLDDVHEVGGLHVNATIVPAALIIAEYSKLFRGRVISGKDFILAGALGADFLCRLRMADGVKAGKSGWVSETFAPIVLAAMGGKMLGFDREKTLNAMGISYAQCAGNIQANMEGALTVRLQQGFGARAGILSLFLAEIGFTGARDMLEGKYGLFPLYMHGDYDPEVLTAELGRRYEGNNVSIKPYPCCKYTHGAIYGALQLAAEHGFKADDVNRVVIFTGSRPYDVVGYGERKVRPQTVPDAQFSLYYTVATALVKGKVFIEDFTEEAILDSKVLAVAQRVEVVVDVEKDKSGVAVCPTDIRIETKDGKQYQEYVEIVKGHPENPMSWDEVVQKLKDCACFSARPLPVQNIDRISQMAGDLDKLDDVTAILEHVG